MTPGLLDVAARTAFRACKLLSAQFCEGQRETANPGCPAHLFSLYACLSRVRSDSLPERSGRLSACPKAYDPTRIFLSWEQGWLAFGVAEEGFGLWEASLDSARASDFDLFWIPLIGLL